ncbi:HNH endonuclease family protein [Streptomyces sp. NBC_01431]|uniref:HNH endonuclease family protein n=1 Tax=Streptomyces sp. NBC_01431 TaxID=2903863 RepID=UPI002E348B92|nr:HNH endonuclease family protein [Streptomyces sp. NBC_01431]
MRTYRIALPATALAACLVLTGCGGGDAKKGPSGAPGPTGAAGSALAAVDSLTVKGRAPKTGYSRDQFGKGWTDTDHNGCQTREDILKRDLKDVKYKDKCDVASGTLVHDPYTGEAIQFQRGASKIDIDHVVALSDAWQKGAQQWDKDKRTRFANDPLNLIAVDASANRRKSDGDAATWLPPYTAYRCTYVADQVAVKKKYGVWLTDAEKTAMKTVLGTCPTQQLPAG